MHHLGKSKVTKLNAKAGVVYPLIRLPKTCADEIGKVAEIFETEQDNRRALLVTFNDRPSEVMQPNAKVIQLLPEVIQPEGLNNVESRLQELESEIKELKSLILLNASYIDAKSKKGAPESGFEPESEPRQGSMIGRYTTRACARKATA
jgi:hypothetical protein